MDAGTAAHPLTHSLEMPPWKTAVSHLAAALIALIFISSGVWKITDPFGWARALTEFLVPAWLSLPFTLTLGIAEAFGGAMILVPGFRRWGAILTSLLLLAFMGYIGIHYAQLVGKDCSCFPIVKRTVGPMFFVGDGLMLLAAIVAGWWGHALSGKKRTAAVALGAVVVFAGVSYGSALTHQTGLKAPESVMVEGKPYSLQYGRIFLFFYDPECSHCDHASRVMSKYRWKSDVHVIAIPTRQQQFAAAFLSDTQLKAVTSLEVQKLKGVFKFGDPPYGVALDNGRQVSPLPTFEDAEPEATLRKLGYVE